MEATRGSVGRDGLAVGRELVPREPAGATWFVVLSDSELLDHAFDDVWESVLGGIWEEAHGDRIDGEAGGGSSPLIDVSRYPRR
jgi:hypothetical protein